MDAETRQKLVEMAARHEARMADPLHRQRVEADPFYWKMRELAAKMTMQIAASRRQRAELELERQAERGHASERPSSPSRLGGASIVRERPPQQDQLDRIERDLAGLRVLLESNRDDVRIVAEGIGETHDRFQAIERRLDAIERRLDAIERRLDAVERRLDAVERRLDAVEARLDTIERRLDDHERRLRAVEAA